MLAAPCYQQFNVDYNEIRNLTQKKIFVLADCSSPFMVNVHTDAVTDAAANANTANTIYSRGEFISFLCNPIHCSFEFQAHPLEKIKQG